MTVRHRTIISDRLATNLSMMLIAFLGGVMITAMWLGNQPQPPKLDPNTAYCHAWMETQAILAAPASVTFTFKECMSVSVRDELFDEETLQGPLLPGEESVHQK